MTEKMRRTLAWRPDLRAFRPPALGGTPTGSRDGWRGKDGQTLTGGSRLAAWVNFVKLPHTAFALPFAIIGTVYASFRYPVGWIQVAWIFLAFSAARFAAMAFNRIVDARLDAANARTSGRELPTGRLRSTEAGWAVVGAAALFMVAAAQLNQLSLLLSAPALVWILVYSWTKRFTSWSHLWLGGALAIAPVGGYIAITGAWSDPWWILPVLAGAVALWVAGFDMFYALQDADFDREHGLGSAVVLLGEKRSIMLAKFFHGITIALLIWFGYATDFGVWYYSGVGVAALVLVWEHQLVKPGDYSRVDTAFFTYNGIVAVALLAFAVADRLAF